MTGGPGVDLVWLPLGAGEGGGCVRSIGRLYEALAARRDHRDRMSLFHSALVVRVRGSAFAIEMTPVWAVGDQDRGVVGEGPVGMPVLGRSSLFRYEVRCWRNGTIPHLPTAVDSPRQVSTDGATSTRVLDLVAVFPRATWGLDEQQAGEMWSSNSLTWWLLASSGHDLGDVVFRPPRGGRAPGWAAGLAVARRSTCPSAGARADRSTGRIPRD